MIKTHPASRLPTPALSPITRAVALALGTWGLANTGVAFAQTTPAAPDSEVRALDVVTVTVLAMPL